jgi:hypothetical protein
MAVYLINGEQNKTAYVVFDVISSTLILALGIVMVLQTISLKQGILRTSGHRIKTYSVPMMLFISVTTVFASVTVLGLLRPSDSYYAIASFDAVITVALFVSLRQM